MIFRWPAYLVSVDIHEHKLPLGHSLLVGEVGVGSFKQVGEGLRPVGRRRAEPVGHKVHQVTKEQLLLRPWAFLPSLLDNGG